MAAMTPAERKTLDDYVAAVRAHYGARLVDVLVFGSRARGDARPDSDVDLAIILEDGDWVFWDEKMFLSGLAYDPLLESGLYIQPWPVARSAWEAPEKHRNPFFIQSIQEEGRQLKDLL
jgi:hypothetical protein